MASCKIRTILVFAVIIVGDTKRPNLKEGTMPEKRDYRPSKWVANSAMDVWYGNKSMIDVISREFADIMFKLTARPGMLNEIIVDGLISRSVIRYQLDGHKRNSTTRKHFEEILSDTKPTYQKTSMPPYIPYFMKKSTAPYVKPFTPSYIKSTTPTEVPPTAPSNLVSRIEINFVDADNQTFQTIKLEPMKQKNMPNNTVFRVLEPLLRAPDY